MYLERVRQVESSGCLRSVRNKTERKARRQAAFVLLLLLYLLYLLDLLALGFKRRFLIFLDQLERTLAVLCMEIENGKEAVLSCGCPGL